MKKKDLIRIGIGATLIFMFILGIKCFSIIEKVIPKYANCYQHLNMGMPSLTKFYFQTSYMIRNYPLHVGFFIFIGIVICILLAVFVKNKTVPLFLFISISFIFILFISFFGRAMVLPLVKRNQLLEEALDVHTVKLEIEKGNCPFINLKKMLPLKQLTAHGTNHIKQESDNENPIKNNSEEELNRSNPIVSLQKARLKDIEVKAWKILQEMALIMETFRFAGEELRYPASIIELTDARPPFIEKKEIDSIKKYYNIQITESGTDTYKVIVSPTIEGEKIGLHSIMVDQTGVIRILGKISEQARR